MVTHKTSEVTITRIDVGKDQVHLSDGRVIDHPARSRKRSPKTGPSANLSTDPLARFSLILSNPESYRLFDHITIGTTSHGGSPGIYPRQMFSLIYALQNAFASQSAISQALKFKIYLNVVTQMLTNTLSTVPPDDRVRIKKWLLKPTTPSPSRISRMFRTLEDRGANQHDALREQGIRLSLEDNRFSRANKIHSKKNQIVGDGTVLKAATSHRGGEVVDFATGEIRARRTDSLSQEHTEGGGDQTYGTKFALIWSAGPHRHDTIALGASFVNSPSPQKEADVAIALVQQVQADLKNMDAAASVLAYDRAAGRKEQEALNNVGIVLATRAIMDNAPDDTSHYRKPKPIGHITAPCGATHYFAAIQKRLHQVIKDVGGKSAYIRVAHIQRPKSTGGQTFHYTEHRYECRCEIGATHVLRISWNGRKSALASSKNSIKLAGDKGYDNMLRYLQPHAPDSDEFAEISGTRQTAEAMHSIIDQMLPFKRLQRWTLGSKESWVFGYLIGHNLVHQQLRRELGPGTLTA